MATFPPTSVVGGEERRGEERNFTPPTPSARPRFSRLAARRPVAVAAIKVGEIGGQLVAQ
jgi:hypothetical protein